VKLLGLSLTEITQDLRDELTLEKDLKGLVVAQVDTHSTADVAGIKQQDVVTKVNDEPVRTLQDFYRAFNSKKGDVKISFVRQGIELSIGLSR
jgi:serine protease Do